jgi:hypothetical protein
MPTTSGGGRRVIRDELSDPVDVPSTNRVRADSMSDERYLTVAELAVLIDLAAERLYDLQRDWLALQEQLVRAHAMLGSLPALMECHEPPADIWGDQTSA